MADYTGKEDGRELSVTDPVEPNTVFDLKPTGVPAGAVPIFDDDFSAVVGYRHESAIGVYKIYDLEGKIIGIEEKELETPLFDPIDLLFFGGGIVRAIGKGILKGTVRAAPKVAALTATKLSTRMLTASIVGVLRTTFKGLSARSLKFTAVTAERMAMQGRHVPLHILHLALK